MIQLQVVSISVLWFCLFLFNACKAQNGFAENAKLSNDSLLWGPYRPNLYFGIRPRLPKSLLTGLLWARVDSFDAVQHSMLVYLVHSPSFCSKIKPSAGILLTIAEDFRHTCEQNEMAGYGWDEYDVRHGGRQTIHDEGNSIDITTEFIKIPGGQHGGSWGVRIKGNPRENAPQQLYTTMVFYAGMEGFGSLSVKNQENELGIVGPVIMEGSTTELGHFTLEITQGPTTNRHPQPSHPSYAAKPLDRTRVLSLKIPEVNLWQTKRRSEPLQKVLIAYFGRFILIWVKLFFSKT